MSKNGVGSTENDCVVKFSLLNPNLRRVWPFGGIFCLTFFREGCSPAARLDEPPLFLISFFTFPTTICGGLAVVWLYRLHRVEQDAPYVSDPKAHRVKAQYQKLNVSCSFFTHKARQIVKRIERSKT